MSNFEAKLSNMETICYGQSIDINKKKLQHIHDILSLVLGIGSGILTLESISGFLFYIIGFTLTNLAFYTVCCQGQPKTFFKNPIKEIFIDGVFSNIAGYIMMWCLVYALVKSSS